MLHIIYRTYGGENKKGRPPYYSKLLSLMSLIRAARQVETTSVEIIYIIDGEMPADRLQAMEASGEVLLYSTLGIFGSIREAFKLPMSRRWPPEDLVWFAEDDYLYQPRALNDLVAATKAFPEADYFGLYALIGSRRPDGGLAEDHLRIPRRWTGLQARTVNGHPWRGALSTTHTFGMRVSALAEHGSLMHYATRFGGAYDHATALLYQGFSPYSLQFLKATFLDGHSASDWLRRLAILGRRVWLNAYSALRMRGGARVSILIAADPALVTHLETAYLAAGTDWAGVAEETREWMAFKD